MFEKTKRSYLKALFTEAVSLFEEVNGKPQYLLADLQKVPDEIIQDMVPVFSNITHSRIEDGWLLLRDESSGQFVRRHALQGLEQYILDRFDGRHSIKGICNCLAADHGLTWLTAFHLVKDIFVHCTKAGICHPAGGQP